MDVQENVLSARQELVHSIHVTFIITQEDGYFLPPSSTHLPFAFTVFTDRYPEVTYGYTDTPCLRGDSRQNSDRYI